MEGMANVSLKLRRTENRLCSCVQFRLLVSLARFLIVLRESSRDSQPKRFARSQLTPYELFHHLSSFSLVLIGACYLLQIPATGQPIDKTLTAPFFSSAVSTGEAKNSMFPMSHLIVPIIKKRLPLYDWVIFFYLDRLL